MTRTTSHLFVRTLAAIAAGSALSVIADSNSAAALVRTPMSRIYLADEGRIFELNTTQNRLDPVTRDIAAQRLLIDGQNNVYASALRYDPRSDLYRPTMWRYSAEAGGLTEAAGTAAAEFTFSDVADADGNLYFWQYDSRKRVSRIMLRSRQGDLIALAGNAWGRADGRGTDARLGRLGSITVGPSGVIYFTDEECVRQVDRQGNVTTVASGGQLALGSGRAPRNHLASIAVDEKGCIYVGDLITHRIFLVEPSGTVSTLTYSPDNWAPVSLAWSDGALYVLETDRDTKRVVRVSANGTRTELPRNQDEPAGTAAEPVRLSQAGGTPGDRRSTLLPVFLMPIIPLPHLF